MSTEPSNLIPAPERVAGEPINAVQRCYLDGLFAGIRNRAAAFGDAPKPDSGGTGNPEPSQVFEERVKAELDPFDAYRLLLEDAAGDRPPERENVFRFKWHGLFYLAPTRDGFMARLRIPAGQVKTYQLREIAAVARDLTTGYVQVTTRANFQVRLIKPRNTPEVLRRIQSVGLHTRGAGADNIRNLTANPTAGIAPDEIIDTTPYCHELAQLILNIRAFYNLPRKFNIAFDGGGGVGVVEDTNDIGARAVRVTDETADAAVPKGVYFRLALGGATGHKAFARDLGVLVKPADIVRVIAATVQVYLEHGNRSNRKRARLKHLLDKWSLDEFRGKVEEKLGSAGGFLDDPLDAEGRSVRHGETPSADAHSHVGVYPQKQPGLYYVGVALPAGQITPKQMLRLADLADHYGSGEVRLTVWQNLILPGIGAAYVETVKRALVKMGLDWRQSNLRSGLIACTGNVHCKYAASNTKAHALALADYLEKRFELDQPINIHLTGCPHSCAQHYMGDIGLLGAAVKRSGESVEGYHVFVGGGFGTNQALGRQVFQGIPFDELKTTLAKMLAGYLRHRRELETFQQFSTRHDLNTLQAIFSNDE